jgi:hypothetical protein
VPKEDVNIIIEDFNAQAGSDRAEYEKMKGHFGEGNRNNEGRDLLDMCTKNG